jgi:hypothetical protein
MGIRGEGGSANTYRSDKNTDAASLAGWYTPEVESEEGGRGKEMCRRLSPTTMAHNILQSTGQ